MRIPYIHVVANLACKEPFQFHTYPTFLLRSVLGRSLRRLTCFFKRNTSCETCVGKYACVYSRLFETPIDRNNPVLQGRNRVPHPLILYTPVRRKTPVTSFDLEILLIGADSSSLGFLYMALLHAGENGLGKARVPFTVSDMTAEGKSLIQEPYQIQLPSLRWWTWDDDETLIEEPWLTVHLLSPVRFKKEGKYQHTLGITDLLSGGFRRLLLLAQLYGETPTSPAACSYTPPAPEVEHRRLRWVDFPYYSSRQKESLRMGGVVGAISACGPWRRKDLSLLQGLGLFRVGKNPIFGFGKIGVEVTKEDVHEQRVYSPY